MGSSKVSTHEDILQFHCPRFEELPDLDLYMDQVLQVLDTHLYLFIEPGETRVMTKTMINNYVKHGIIYAPVKKKYTRYHLAYLIVVSFLKKVYSMQEISSLLQFQMISYPFERAYNYFCDELEQCLQATFTNQPISHHPATDEDLFAVHLIQHAIQSTVDKIYVQKSMDEVIRRILEKKESSS